MEEPGDDKVGGTKEPRADDGDASGAASAETSATHSTPGPVRPRRLRQRRPVPPPSITRTFVVTLLGSCVAVVLAGIAATVLGRLLWDKDHIGQSFLQLASAQAAFFLVALWGAKAESTNLRTRLSWHRRSVPASTLALLMLGSLAVWALGVLLHEVLQADQWLPPPGEVYQRLSKMITEAPWVWRIAFLLLGSVGPGICEEALFRGYLQTRLLASWTPTRAIAVSGTMFACAHMDLHHILAILPACFWLGYVAFRCRSIVPGMFCHAFINVCGLSLLATGAVDTDLWASPWAICLPGLIGLPALVLAIRRLEQGQPVRHAAPSDVEAGT